MTRTLVIGVGNADRGDDGVGLEVARRLEKHRGHGLEVRRLDADGVSLLEAWRGADDVIVVDAVVGAGPPGRVVCFRGHDGVPTGTRLCGSSHDIGVAEAIGLARVLGWLPRRLVVYGVQAQTFEAGAHLSPSVAAGVHKVVRQVLRDARRRIAKKRPGHLRGETARI